MDKKELVRIGYNQIASKYLEMRNEDLPEMHLLREFVKNFPKNADFLDAGCGAGLPFTKFLSERFNVIGIDISEIQIDLARKNVPKARFICQDMVSLIFPDNTFDGIISYYAIFHIPREEHENLLSKFYKMLKPGGRALLCLNQRDDPGSYEVDFFGFKMYWSSFNFETYIVMLENIGFTIEKIEKIPDSLGDCEHPFFFLVK